jgi:VanZ family protein
MHRPRRVLAALTSLLVYAAIFYLSSLPPRRLPSGIPDIIPHAVEFAALAFFLAQVFASPRRPSSLLAAFLVALPLGLLDEAHQLSTPGRIFSWLDFLYDGLGALIGLAACVLLRPRRKGP